MPLFAIPGLRVQAAALRSGGKRTFALPDPGPDATEAEALLEEFRARRRELSGERRLFLAVFMGVLLDLHRYPRGTRPYALAWQWIMDDREDWPLAFRPACAVLDLDAGAVRQRVCAALAVGAPWLGTLKSRGHVYRGRSAPTLSVA